MNARILVIAAHADDEALGCGGTMIRHTDEGSEVAVLFMTDGVGSRTGSASKEAQQRDQAMDVAMGVMGVTKCERLDFPDNALDGVPLLEIVQAIESFCDTWGSPDRVYTHHPADLNVDHQLAYRASMTCFRPQPSDRVVKEILTFEVPSSTGWLGGSTGTGFLPNWYRDISEVLPRKMDALRAYEREMRSWPHARSYEAVEALARFRGSSVGIAAAEAFCLERAIE